MSGTRPGRHEEPVESLPLQKAILGAYRTGHRDVQTGVDESLDESRQERLGRPPKADDENPLRHAQAWRSNQVAKVRSIETA